MAKRKSGKVRPDYEDPWDHPKCLDLNMSGDEVLKVSDRGERESNYFRNQTLVDKIRPD